jgi:group I intron endonuclease
MNIYTVYKITCLYNNKLYIGYTKNSLKYRLNSHFKNAAKNLKHNKNNKFSNAILKYGKINFTIEPISTFHSKEEATNFEKEMIIYFNSFKEGYNSTLGGDGGGTNIGIPLSKEHKQKISDSLKGRIFTEEHKNKISENHKDVSGSNNPFFGKNHSLETKNKISNREYKKGEEHHFYGKKPSTSFKEGKDHPKSIAIIIDNVEYGSLTLAAKALGVSRGTIKRKYLNGEN